MGPGKEGLSGGNERSDAGTDGAKAAAQKKMDEINRRQSDALAAANQADNAANAKQQQLDQVNSQLGAAQADVCRAQGDLDQAPQDAAMTPRGRIRREAHR